MRGLRLLVEVDGAGRDAQHGALLLVERGDE
jgi:hypothetical protein